MVSNTKEQALEAAIEQALTGTTIEAVKAAGEIADGAHTQVRETPADYLVGNQRFKLGLPTDFNAQYAIDNRFFWRFLEQTQTLELAKLQKHNPSDWQRKLLERYDRLMKKHGILHLLKKGLSVDDAHFHLMYPAPLASSSEKVKQNFAANIFSCTRQVCYSLANPLQEIDMVLFLNGIPLVTLELKNAWTGQTARYHGQKQYREDRDTNQPLLNFARCLVHMAVDTDEVYMTTKLAGKGTFFLPFNKGHNHGKGNPPNPSGHKTAYLWEQVFTKDSMANIIQHFVRLDGSSKDPLAKRTLFFPRYHQLDVVRRLVKHAAEYGVGQSYLIQHSAGSGKSNSITWAAYQLIETYPLSETVEGNRGMEQPLFDSVIVVTDRRLLDKQLRDNIKEFSEVKNIVAPAFKSSELKHALEAGKKIIITTIQKFPFIIDGIEDLSDKRFAVIIDEAHSSQSGSAHDNMNRAMGQSAIEEEEDAQDKILMAMKSRKMRGNASYLAFTATPKNTTLEKFGEQQADGSFKPFHLYSMKQAIEEGFILDVLANYTTYKSYYEIEKSIAENPEFDTKKAQKKLRAYVERSQHTIDTKAEIMLEHFIAHVINGKKLKGKAKAMVITQNIETAIRYHKALTRLLIAKGSPFKALIAFSGTKEVDGIEYTEAEINGFSESDTKDKFDTDEYRMLVVANKYLTGFDQPKLSTMYVDKKLASVLCVQALSRLNRSSQKLGKKTEDLFILDFFNNVDDIKTAFDPFYTATSLSQATDINVLHELKDALDDVGVYEWYEVEDFVKRYFNNEDAQKLSPIIDVAAARFEHELELEDSEKIDFKIKAKQFVKIYGQMASIIPYEIAVWEKLFWFLKFLIPKLKVSDPDADAIDELLSSVDLSSYGLQRVKLNQAIALDAGETEVDPQNPNPRGAHGVEVETDPLDEIVRSFNERWFQGWSATPEEQRVKFVNIAESIRQHPDFEDKYKNNPDPHNRELAFEKILKEIMLRRRKDELELYKLFAGDVAFKASWMQSMQRVIDRG
ncbi:helicase, type I site-specific restriction-modification system restriction subunit [Spongiibacter sp. IMCC21906]|uniref:type I restriction endonuclease subunit R n=1 Tax=Spongiibacter sp. IMCC21906 TaxID=1620392 RepID=UPI00062DE351|nr:type I restriction endonuclease subunit R [Spongiibacter sp. IMCC21906]AKH68164.1 helicase, type I site-specific restriction-modification system restriction subunit [Spongiibacter sp. IMCC21906]